jgi:phosphoribosylformimino-5-aminoimidazole carboxamide ribonucleotide (ProFAR) isomerase
LATSNLKHDGISDATSPRGQVKHIPYVIFNLSMARGAEANVMIVPCIDLMDGKVVQLVQGRDKALEVDNPLEVLARFQAFPQIQVIDLDAAMGRGGNPALVALLAAHAVVRAGGGIRSAERARQLVDQGVYRVIVGTAAFDHPVLEAIVAQVGKERVTIALDSRGGRVVVRG